MPTALALELDKATAADMLARLKPSLPRSGSLAVLDMIRVDADPVTGRARFTTTDLDLTTVVEIDVPGPAEPFLIEPKMFDRLVKQTAKAGSVAMARIDESSVNLGNGKLSVDAKVPDIAEYPRLKMPMNPVTGIALDQLDRLLVSVSTDDNRPILTGILVTPAGELVSTDSYRLCAISTGQPVDGLDAPILVPGRWARTVAKFAGPDMTVTVNDGAHGPTDVAVTITGDGIRHTIVGHLIEGDYPNYGQLIPQGNLPLALAFSEYDVAALESFRKFADPAVGASPLRFEREEAGRIIARMIGQDVGDFRVELDTIAEGGDHVHVAFSPTYLLDFLRESPGRVLAGTDSLKPWLFTDTDDAGVTVRRLLMPVRVQ